MDSETFPNQNSCTNSCEEPKKEKLKIAKEMYAGKDEPEFIIDSIKKQRELIQREYGIYSLTTLCDSIVMWAHYANSHKGACLQFRMRELVKFIDDVSLRGTVIDLYPVSYHKEYPLYTSRDAQGEGFLLPLCTKSISWGYEKECRLILIGETNKCVELPNNIIDKVIFGCKTQSTIMHEAIELISEKQKEVSFYRAELKDNKFGLNFIEIE